MISNNRARSNHHQLNQGRETVSPPDVVVGILVAVAVAVGVNVGGGKAVGANDSVAAAGVTVGVGLGWAVTTTGGLANWTWTR